MEELNDKFANNSKMKAKYEIYQKKRLAIIQTIKNSLQEKDLMLEIMTRAVQPYEFSASKRNSLILQQNAGYRSHVSPLRDLDGASEGGDYAGQIFLAASPNARFEPQNKTTTFTTPKSLSRL